eukprot:6957910-Heterocapsa_arctica.AAC.1
MDDTGKKGIFQDDWIQNKHARLLKILGRRKHADGGRRNETRRRDELTVRQRQANNDLPHVNSHTS